MSWETLYGWCDDIVEPYRRAVAEAPPGSILVEVGVFLGRSACALSHFARAAGKGLRVYAVDPWGPDISGWGPDGPMLSGGHPFTSALRGMLEQAPDDLEQLTLLRLPSVQASRVFDDRSVQFAFIDACHEYAAVQADIAAWRTKVCPGGVLAGHDYRPTAPGVVRAVDEAFRGRVEVSGSVWQVRP